MNFTTAEHAEIPAEALLLSDGLLTDQALVRGILLVLLIALRVHSSLALHVEELSGKLALFGRDGLGALETLLSICFVVG